MPGGTKNPYTSEHVGKSVKAALVALLGICIMCCGGGYAISGSGGHTNKVALAISVVVGIAVTVLGSRMMSGVKREREQAETEKGD